MMYREINTGNSDSTLETTVAEGSAQDRVPRSLAHRLSGDESGQVLPWVVVMMLSILAVAALVVDLGHAMVVQRVLQQQTDAAALAAAESLSGGNYSTVGQSFSGAGSDKNAYAGVSVGTPTITPLCLTTVSGWGLSCTSTAPNAVSVTETASVPTLFASLFGRGSVPLSATSTASPGRPQPYNIAVILDTTPSMANSDTNCGSGQTQLSCAETGVRQLLAGLAPSMDVVSLFTFPNMQTSSVSNEYGCSPSANQSVPPYTFPIYNATSLQTMPYSTTSGGRNPTTTTVQVTYQVTPFSNDYRTSDAATSLNSSSNIVKAVGGKSGCTAMSTGYENTYYAGAIYAAQASLLAEQAVQVSNGVKNSQNVIILLSDGNATAKETSPGGSFSPGSNDMVSSSSQSTTYGDASGNYPNSYGGGSWVGECSQGVDAAQYAATYTNNNSTVYTISYGSPSTSSSGNCASDRNSKASHYDITPCEAMQQMSSGWPNDKSHFYSDYYLPGSDSGCQAADQNNTITSLNNIFKSILVNLTGARLIPNGTP
ncbi:MAG TPA: pilus assembly protein TadG-related protein [Acidobacteriaceae bacterium]|jgi:Flp pilus assembly protein TadG|nr:pilus assembly protein TadG-related protein [Acidobacteriaceae bacterium]